MFSSSEVYGTPTKVPTNEKEMLKIEDIFNPFSYSAGKIISESIINFLRNLDTKFRLLDHIIFLVKTWDLNMLFHRSFKNV